MSGYLLKFKKQYSVKIGGRRYPVVKIGNQLWMAENLDYAWSGLTIGGRVSSDPRANYYDNDEITYGWNGYKCGLLYNWAAVEELISLLPDGWHVPSDNEWTELMYATPDVYQAAYSLSNGSLAWAPDWTGENMYGLNLIPGGQRYGSNGTFHEIGTVFNIWSSNRYDWWRSGNKFISEYVNNNTQLSIRLVSFDYGKVTIGGRDYKTIKIGNQEWLAENLDWKFDVNGSQIPIGQSGMPSTPAAWYYNNDEATYGIDGTYKCGLLYNWYAVDYLETNKSTLLPSGWHVPSKTEWEALIASVGTNPGTKLKASDDIIVSGFPSGWGGIDDLGFGMLPCGIRYNVFQSLNSRAFPWTSTVYDGDSSLAYSPALRPNDSNFPMEGDYKTAGNCLRLVKDLT